MNGIVNTIVPSGVGASAIPSVPASRGVLMQGTGLSVAITSVFGAGLQAPKRVIEADKPQRSWHPTFANLGAKAAHAETNPAYLPQAARLREADPATVIRSRHRSRLR